MNAVQIPNNGVLAPVDSSVAGTLATVCRSLTNCYSPNKILPYFMMLQVTYFDFAPRQNTVVYCRAASIGELSLSPSPKIGAGISLSISLKYAAELTEQFLKEEIVEHSCKNLLALQGP